MSEVHRATPAEYDALALLQWRWRVEEWGRQPERPLTDFRDAFRHWTEAREQGHVPFIATDEGGMLGMAWLAVFERVPTPHRWTRRGASLQSVYVVPSRRNAGIGESLVRAALEHATQIGIDYVIVHPSERSFDFYRRLGFSGSGSHLALELER